MDAEAKRKVAVRRLRAKRDLRTHAFTYLAVNALLVVIWAFSGAGFFWPGFTIVFWGFGLAMHAWGVYGGTKPITEADVQREMDRLGDADVDVSD